ncbi:MAG: 50S ribosomal protein L6 [Candidatus Neomarinimicrobiota bacterium]
MSRIGKKEIIIPAGVTVAINDAVATVKGPKGTLTVAIHPEISVKQNNGSLVVERPSDNRKHRALHGTMRMLVANAISGVSEGYVRELRIIGVGYQAQMQGSLLVMQLGYSHAIYFEPPVGIEIEAKRTEIKISGIDKQLVGEVAAKIRSFRKPEPYKGKGIRYVDEYVRSKQGKTVGGSK